jgi:hypothetical protein
MADNKITKDSLEQTEFSDKLSLDVISKDETDSVPKADKKNSTDNENDLARNTDSKFYVKDEFNELRVLNLFFMKSKINYDRF